MQPHTFLIQIIFHRCWVFFSAIRSLIAYPIRVSVTMNLNHLLNPNTPPHRLLKPTCVSKSASSHSQSRTTAPQRTTSPSVRQVASQVTQTCRYLYSAVRPVAWPTGNRHEVTGESHDQPSQKPTAHYGSCRVSALAKLPHTLNLSTADAPRFKHKPTRDVNTLCVAASIVTSIPTIKKTKKAVKQAPKRCKKDENPAPVTTKPSHESTALRTSQPQSPPKDANVAKTDLAARLKRVSHSVALDLGLGARPRKIIRDVLRHPVKLLVPDANEAKSKKRKRAAPERDGNVDPASAGHRFRRQNLEKPEVGTFGGWVAFRRVEA